MNNKFGKLLKAYMKANNVKEQSLAEVLRYDATYVSKWINGSKLPSEKKY